MELFEPSRNHELIYFILRSGLARLGVLPKSFEKESNLMNFCNVNGKIPDLKRHHPAQHDQHDQLQQTLSNARMLLFCSVSLMKVGGLE